MGSELVAAAVLGRRGRQSGWGPPAAGAEEGRKSRSRSSVWKGLALEEQEGAAGSEDLLQMQGEAMERREDPRGAKRGRSRGPQRKQSSETEEAATQQGHEHCLACGDGPSPPHHAARKVFLWGADLRPGHGGHPRACGAMDAKRRSSRFWADPAWGSGVRENTCWWLVVYQRVVECKGKDGPTVRNKLRR